MVLPLTLTKQIESKKQILSEPAEGMASIWPQFIFKRRNLLPRLSEVNLNHNKMVE